MNDLASLQTAMLREFLMNRENWECMLLLAFPGDAPFLAPICPHLRGVEICADPSSGRFDIWKGGNLIKSRLRPNALAKWLRKRTPPEAEYLEHGAEWAEDALKRYGLKKHNPEWN